MHSGIDRMYQTLRCAFACDRPKIENGFDRALELKILEFLHISKKTREMKGVGMEMFLLTLLTGCGRG